jgi:MbtH protein
MEHQTDDWDYIVVVNDEDQHAIWPEFKAIPAGWTQVGPLADKATCLAWIEAHWTDLRPKSIRSIRSS